GKPQRLLLTDAEFPHRESSSVVDISHTFKAGTAISSNLKKTVAWWNHLERTQAGHAGDGAA
ncbi:MAG: hypothetical protein U9P12_03950, partial [Verrucomicrobiota bacterium]|nr:hypothetical protein [Verrucomicrobiota bacterium]